MASFRLTGSYSRVFTVFLITRCMKRPERDKEELFPMKLYLNVLCNNLELVFLQTFSFKKMIITKNSSA